MVTEEHDTCVIYKFFDTPQDFHIFLKQKLSEGYEKIPSHGLDRRYVHKNTKKMMRVRLDSFDGRITISK